MRDIAVILGAGPSLTRADADYLADLPAFVIAINDLWRWAPWCDHLHACDVEWWERNEEALELRCSKTVVEPMELLHGFPRRGPGDATVLERLADAGVEILKETGVEGYDPTPGCVRTGHNSGYQALHWSIQQGAKKIVLLGYDMGVSGERKRCHDYGRALGAPNYVEWAGHFDALVEPARVLGVEIINCCERSLIQAFPKAELRDVV